MKQVKITEEVEHPTHKTYTFTGKVTVETFYHEKIVTDMVTRKVESDRWPHKRVILDDGINPPIIGESSWSAGISFADALEKYIEGTEK